MEAEDPAGIITHFDGKSAGNNERKRFLRIVNFQEIDHQLWRLWTTGQKF